MLISDLKKIKNRYSNFRTLTLEDVHIKLFKKYTIFYNQYKNSTIADIFSHDYNSFWFLVSKNDKIFKYSTQKIVKITPFLEQEYNVTLILPTRCYGSILKRILYPYNYTFQLKSPTISKTIKNAFDDFFIYYDSSNEEYYDINRSYYMYNMLKTKKQYKRLLLNGNNMLITIVFREYYTDHNNKNSSVNIKNLLFTPFIKKYGFQKNETKYHFLIIHKNDVSKLFKEIYKHFGEYLSD